MTTGRALPLAHPRGDQGRGEREEGPGLADRCAEPLSPPRARKD